MTQLFPPVQLNYIFLFLLSCPVEDTLLDLRLFFFLEDESCVAVAGCGQSAVDIEAETAALRAAADKYHEAGSAADTAAVASLLAADGSY